MTKVFWLFGRSGAGKTTLGLRVQRALQDRRLPVFYLDGDDMRSGLCSDLRFSSEARVENHRRIAEVAKLAASQDLNVVVSTMAPEHSQRDAVAQVLGEWLVWFYIHAPLNVCIERDPKGLYRRAQAGQLDQLLNFPFEVPRPQEGENFIDTIAQNEDSAAQSILEVVQSALCDFAI